MVASPSPTALTLPSSSTSTISSALSSSSSSSSLVTLYSKELKRSKGIISEPSSIIMYAIILSSSPTFNSKVSLLISSIRTLFLETFTFTTVSEGLNILFPAKLTVISASPSPTATRLPLASTVTTDSSDEVKVISPASLGLSSASILSSSPTYKLKESLYTLMLVSILETLTFIVTLSAATHLEFPLNERVILASPSPTATRLPLASTVTTDSSEDV